jgi:AcrR family transcriptional regulator
MRISSKQKRTRSTAVKKRRGKAPAKSSEAYHHGALREALLEAAEKVLARDGVQGLTLRAAAREAGVSHAAPKHHFGDMAGLLTELAAVGFARLRDSMTKDIRDELSQGEKLDAVGRGYVAFAKTHPALFLMMFRSERLDMTRPALRDAARASSQVLTGALGPGLMSGDRLTLEAAGQVARAWSVVHGFSILLIDGRWKALLAQLPGSVGADALFEAVIKADPPC